MDLLEKALLMHEQENGRETDGLQEDKTFILRIPEPLHELLKETFDLSQSVIPEHAFYLRMLALQDLDTLQRLFK